MTVADAVLGGVPALRLEPPDATGAVLLYLHGGGYVVGSARSGAGLATALARRVGAVAYSLDYRLAPEHPFPAALEDGLAAYRALLDDAGGEAGQVVVAGDSAGGGLALAVLLAARDAGLPQPAAVVVMSPWVDLTLGGESLHAKEADDAIFDAADIAAYASRYLARSRRRRPPRQPAPGRPERAAPAARPGGDERGAARRRHPARGARGRGARGRDARGGRRARPTSSSTSRDGWTRPTVRSTARAASSRRTCTTPSAQAPGGHRS